MAPLKRKKTHILIVIANGCHYGEGEAEGKRRAALQKPTQRNGRCLCANALARNRYGRRFVMRYMTLTSETALTSEMCDALDDRAQIRLDTTNHAAYLSVQVLSIEVMYPFIDI